MIALRMITAMEMDMAKIIHRITSVNTLRTIATATGLVTMITTEVMLLRCALFFRHPCHDAESCYYSTDSEFEKMLEILFFDARGLLQRQREHNMFMFGTNDNPKNKFYFNAPANTKFGLLIADFNGKPARTLEEINKRLDGCICVFPHVALGSSIIFVSDIAFLKDEPSRTHPSHVMNGGQFCITDHQLVVTKAKSKAANHMLLGFTPHMSANMLKINISKKKRQNGDSKSFYAESDVAATPPGAPIVHLLLGVLSLQENEDAKEEDQGAPPQIRFD